MRTIFTLLVLSISLFLSAQTREFTRDSSHFAILQIGYKEILTYSNPSGEFEVLTGPALLIHEELLVINNKIMEVYYTNGQGLEKDLFVLENGRWNKLQEERKLAKLKVRRGYDPQ